MSTISRIGGGYGSYDLYGKVASGKRITKAGDDPAGLAIATKMETQTRSRNMQAQNAASQRDAISVADGGRSGITSYLQDINALSVQGQNGLYSDSDRQAIQNQINQYAIGIDDTIRQTKYNETYMLADGSTSSSALGLHGMENFDLDTVGSAIQNVSASRSKDGASYNGLSSNISNLNTEAENTTASLSRIEDQEIGEAATAIKKQEALNKYQASMQKRQMEDQQNFMNRMFA